tara:strand:+ start:195 stop:491 length:297 start_codon:yes stop_codon:yes gene_type:complete
MKKSKKLKREEAARRQKAYNKLSLEDKFKLIESRRGNSLKETQKIVDNIEVIDKNIYCNVCGESKNTREIGIVYGQFTCRDCAIEMDESITGLGMQHI